MGQAHWRAVEKKYSSPGGWPLTMMAHGSVGGLNGKKVRVLGIKPRTARLQTRHSTTALLFGARQKRGAALGNKHREDS